MGGLPFSEEKGVVGLDGGDLRGVLKGEDGGETDGTGKTSINNKKRMLFPNI